MLRLLHTALKAFPPSQSQGDTLLTIARRTGRPDDVVMRSHADSLCHLGLVSVVTVKGGVRMWCRTTEGDAEVEAGMDPRAVALRLFVDAVNASGGAAEYTDGDVGIMAAIADIRLGEAYMEACKALAVVPMVAPPAPLMDAGGGKALAPTTWNEPCGCVGHLRDDGSTYADPMCAKHADAVERVG